MRQKQGKLFKNWAKYSQKVLKRTVDDAGKMTQSGSILSIHVTADNDVMQLQRI